MAKRKTNKQMFASLFKEIGGSVYEAILRERVVVIMGMTIQNIKENPKDWENKIIHPSMYEELDRIVQKHLGFNN